MALRILLIGGMGSIGSRYREILRQLGIAFEILDTDGRDPHFDVEKYLETSKFDKVIICTPTHTHEEYVDMLLDLKKPLLCEKPVSKNTDVTLQLANKASYLNVPAFVVNNYAFIERERPLKECFPRTLSYQYYNTGRDGLLWDCCQLVYLAFKERAELRLDRKGAIWKFHLGDFEVPYRWVEESYYQMIIAFADGFYDKLWTLFDGHLMSETVQKLYKDLGEKNRETNYFEWKPSLL